MNGPLELAPVLARLAIRRAAGGAGLESIKKPAGETADIENEVIQNNDAKPEYHRP